VLYRLAFESFLFELLFYFDLLINDHGSNLVAICMKLKTSIN